MFWRPTLTSTKIIDASRRVKSGFQIFGKLEVKKLLVGIEAELAESQKEDPDPYTFKLLSMANGLL